MIGSYTVEKCDVTLSRPIQSLTSDVLRVLFAIVPRIFHYLCLRLYPVYTDCPCFEVQDEEDLETLRDSWRRQLEGTKPVEANTE